MRLTYTDIKEQYLRNIGKAGSSDATILADFNLHLSQRYQFVLAKLQDYMVQQPKTTSTVANQQYYHYPPGVSSIESIVVTVGSVGYPVDLVSSQRVWDSLNSATITSTYPCFFFPRRDDFGIFPIPQDAYTMTLNYHIRDRNLAIEDVDGTAGVFTNGSTTFTDANAIFLSNMAGLWVTVTSTTSAGWGYPYRIAGYNSTTSLTLENYWQATSITGASYTIGQSPEIPEEGHGILIDGVTADYYSGLRKDVDTAAMFENKFWTGDPKRQSQTIGDSKIKGGLIGLINRYSDRNGATIVYRSNKLPRWNRAAMYTITS